MNIAERGINSNTTPFIIAEMSGNHNQSIDKAFEIVDAAAKSGVHALKLQTYTADTMTLSIDSDEFCINDNDSLWSGNKLHDLYNKAHTPWDWHKPIMDRAKKLGMLCFSSPFDNTAVDFLEGLGCPAYKIGSLEIVDLPLIRKAASTGKPLLISTGMSSKEEISEALEAAKSQGCVDIILLHCTSSYPSTYKEANLKRIIELQKMHNGVVGLSDHTLDNITSLVSIPFGSSVIEKHIVYSKDKETVDSMFSIDSLQLKTLVSDVNNAWNSIGSSDFKITKGESTTYKYRPSIYTIKNINKGDLITNDCIRIIRPGLGIKPKYYDKVIGMKANVDIASGTPLSWSIIS